MPRAVGLDVGTRTLKLVELSGSAKAFKVQRFLVRPMPEGTGDDLEAARAELVRSLFHEAKVGRDDVCASFDSGATIFREITVPFRERDQIEKVVRFEAENHLHGTAIEDVVVNWIKVGETKDGSQVVIAAAPKAELSADLAVLRRAGIEPASVDLDATALFTACEATGMLAEHPSCVILEVGARTTGLVLVDGGKLRAVRAFHAGADTVSTRIEQDLSLPAGQGGARAMRTSGSDPDALLLAAPRTGVAETSKSLAELEQDASGQRREEFVRKVHRELTRTLTAVRVETPPTVILLAGGGSLLPGLLETLAEKTGLPVQRLALLERLGYRTGGPSPELDEAVAPVAIGCALKVLGADPLGIELRQEEFRPTNTFDVVRASLVAAVTLLAVLLGGLFYLATRRADRERDRFLTAKDSVCRKAATVLSEVEKTYHRDVKGLTPELADKAARKVLDSIPSDENYLAGVQRQLRRRYTELESELNLSKDIPQIESALKVWVEVMRSFNGLDRAQLGWFRITKLSATQGSVSLTIEVDNAGKIDEIVKVLGANEYLKSRAKKPDKPVTPGTFQKNPQTERYSGQLEVVFGEER
jgi:type IV pilus assembly protein PilM